MIDRQQPPTYYEPEYFPIKEVKSETLGGGIPFHYVNTGDQELLRLEIIFQSGKWYEQLNGQSFLTGKLLGEGTKSYSSNEISKFFERNGAFYEYSPGLDFINFNIFCLNKNLNNILPLIAEIISVPSFPEKELATIKNLQIQNLRVNLEKTNFLAARIFREKLFGADHPYGRQTEIRDIENLTRDDITNYFQNFVLNNFEVIVSGKINDKELHLLRDFFGRFTQNLVTVKKSTHFIQHQDKVYEPKEKSLQTSFKIGKLTLKKSDPDYAKLLIFNEVLGGYFGSRLMQKIREEKGYTYGIHSSIISLVQNTFFQISSDIVKEHKEDALNCIYEEIEGMIKTPVPEAELRTVINYFKGSFLSSINTPYALADKFKSIYFHGLDYNYYRQLFESFDEMTPEILHAFIKKNISIDDFMEVRIG